MEYIHWRCRTIQLVSSFLATVVKQKEDKEHDKANALSAALAVDVPVLEGRSVQFIMWLHLMHHPQHIQRNQGSQQHQRKKQRPLRNLQEFR
jgi:7-cyano-7-deazaguanine synthase in queuosine biosynthesis